MDPLGQVLAGPARDGEALLTADLDLGQIARGTLDLDVVGHYARPDIFQLIVDRSPRAAVSLSPDDVARSGSSRQKPSDGTGLALTLGRTLVVSANAM